MNEKELNVVISAIRSVSSSTYLRARVLVDYARWVEMEISKRNSPFPSRHEIKYAIFDAAPEDYYAPMVLLGNFRYAVGLMPGNQPDRMRSWTGWEEFLRSLPATYPIHPRYIIREVVLPWLFTEDLVKSLERYFPGIQGEFREHRWVTIAIPRWAGVAWWQEGDNGYTPVPLLDIRVRDLPLVAGQGGLRVYEAPQGQVKEELFHPAMGRVMNHRIAYPGYPEDASLPSLTPDGVDGLGDWIWAVRGFEDVEITSPDHPDETIRLGPGSYILAHGPAGAVD